MSLRKFCLGLAVAGVTVVAQADWDKSKSRKDKARWRFLAQAAQEIPLPNNRSAVTDNDFYPAPKWRLEKYYFLTKSSVVITTFHVLLVTTHWPALGMVWRFLLVKAEKA